MAKYTTSDIRNVALVGHNASGKTSLADALLFKAKAVPRAGSIEEGTSIFDHEQEEHERKVTIDLAMATAVWQNKQVSIFDTPGYYDFCGEALSAMAGAETALICVNAAAGVMVNTRKMGEAAKRLGVARAVVINKCDLDNVDLPKLIASIRETFGSECVPFTLANATGGAIKSVIDVPSGGKDAPAELAGLCTEAREKMMEVDDKLLEKYLEGQEVKAEELVAVLPKAIAAGKLVPILCTSVAKDVGVKELLDFIAGFLPSPDALWAAKGLTHGKADAPFTGQVIKSIHDPFVGRLAFVKVFSGVLKTDTPIYNVRTEKQSRIGGLGRMFGKDLRAAPDFIPGDVCAVTKVDDLLVNDTVALAGHKATFEPLKFPAPMVALAVEPKTKSDDSRMSTALTRLTDSDPTIKLTRDQATGELVLTAMSQLHMDIAILRLKRKFEVEVATKAPKIPFKETCTGRAEVTFRHKKQTGGRGQFAEVAVRVEANPRGGGFEFVNDISQGRIPIQFIPSVEKGARGAMDKGVYAGYTVVDVKVTLFDGKFHEVDSDNRSFEMAGSKAFKQAFLAAKPALLEPIVNLEVIVPSKYMGDITGNLNSRRGRIMGIDSAGEQQSIKAVVPLMEVMNYSTELRSMTGGEGFYSMEFSHYDVLPSRLAEQVAAKFAKKDEDDE